MAPLRHVARQSSSVVRRSFSTSPERPASVLFALGALSNSRETQHFNKLSRLQRIEHSPSLKLIKTGEIDPYPLPTPPNVVREREEGVRKVRLPARIWDARALQVGRAVLADNARLMFRMRKDLEKARQKESQAKAMLQSELAAWAKERQKLRNELRAAGVWILLLVGTATGLAMWRFWPSQTSGGLDSGEMGRKIAEKVRSAMPLREAAEGWVSAAVASPPIGVTGPSTSAVPAAKAVEKQVAQEIVETQSYGQWVKGLFWKKP